MSEELQRIIDRMLKVGADQADLQYMYDLGHNVGLADGLRTARELLEEVGVCAECNALAKNAAPREVPPTKEFPDGWYINYWRDINDECVIWGQLHRPTGKMVRSKFTYEGA